MNIYQNFDYLNIDILHKKLFFIDYVIFICTSETHIKLNLDTDSDLASYRISRYFDGFRARPERERTLKR